MYSHVTLVFQITDILLTTFKNNIVYVYKSTIYNITFFYFRKWIIKFVLHYSFIRMDPSTGYTST